MKFESMLYELCWYALLYNENNKIVMTNLVYKIRLPLFTVVLHLKLSGRYFSIYHSIFVQSLNMTIELKWEYGMGTWSVFNVVQDRGQ